MSKPSLGSERGVASRNWKGDLEQSENKDEQYYMEPVGYLVNGWH